MKLIKPYTEILTPVDFEDLYIKYNGTDKDN